MYQFTCPCAVYEYTAGNILDYSRFYNIKLAVLTIISDAKHLKGSSPVSSDCSRNCAVSKGHFKLLKQLKFKKWVTMNTALPKYKITSFHMKNNISTNNPMACKTGDIRSFLLVMGRA